MIRTSGMALGVAMGLAGACNLGDGGTNDFSSFGGTDANPTSSSGDADDDDDDDDDDVDTSGAGEAEGDGTTAALDGGTTAASTGAVTTATGDDDDDDDDNDDVTTSSTGDGTTGDPTTGGGSTTDPTTGGGEESSSGGAMPGDDYEPCNPDGTCDTPGEICLQVGAGGFCTQTCVSDDMCPPTPPGTALTASCEFLLGFPDFSADYCGMIGCNFILNDCPGGMTCTPVVMGLTVCEWL